MQIIITCFLLLMPISLQAWGQEEPVESAESVDMKDVNAYNAGLALIDAGPSFHAQACEVFATVQQEYPNSNVSAMAAQKRVELGEACATETAVEEVATEAVPTEAEANVTPLTRAEQKRQLRIKRIMDRKGISLMPAKGSTQKEQIIAAIEVRNSGASIKTTGVVLSTLGAICAVGSIAMLFRPCDGVECLENLAGFVLFGAGMTFTGLPGIGLVIAGSNIKNDGQHMLQSLGQDKDMEMHDAIKMTLAPVLSPKRIGLRLAVRF